MKPGIRKILLYGCVLLAGVGLAYLITTDFSVVSGLAGQWSGLMDALQPVVVGAVLAYLFYPMANASERHMLRHGMREKYARGISIALASLVMLVIFFLVVGVLIPRLVQNLTPVVKGLPDQARHFYEETKQFFARNDIDPSFFEGLWNRLYLMLEDWLKKIPLSTLGSMVTGIYSAAKVIFNLVVGIIVMVYLLAARDRFMGQGKKILYAVCGNRQVCANILKHLRQINRIFSGFIIGKLLDSLIIGLLCLPCLSILQIPYAGLISLVVGCTNIIPVFGPFIGAIPCAFFLLLEDPGACLVFIIFIIILQQIDGNIIGPMILGDSVGLPAFWVLFSLLFFQHFMGFWGMLLGVPLFASIYYLIKQLIAYLLARRALPTETGEYIELKHIDDDGQLVYLTEEDKRRKRKRKPNDAEKEKPPEP